MKTGGEKTVNDLLQIILKGLALIGIFQLIIYLAA
jgi:hypothetical protein